MYHVEYFMLIGDIQELMYSLLACVDKATLVNRPDKTSSAVNHTRPWGV